MTNEEILKWISDVKAKGYTDEQIKEYLLKQGFQQDVVNSLLISKISLDQSVTSTPHKFSNPFLIGIYLGAIILIVLLFFVGLYAIKTINKIHDEEFIKPNLNNSILETAYPKPTATPLVSSANVQKTPNRTRDDLVADELVFCINSSFNYLLSLSSGTSASKPNLRYQNNSQDTFYFLDHNVALSRNFTQNSFSKNIPDRINTCIYSKLKFKPLSTTADFSVVDKNFIMNATITDLKGDKYSGQIIEKLG
jgi:hypothetical protein